MVGLSFYCRNCDQLAVDIRGHKSWAGKASLHIDVCQQHDSTGCGHNIMFWARCRHGAVHWGESVPELTWPGPHVSRLPQLHLPTLLTHCLQHKQQASHEWVPLEPAWKRHYHPEPVSMSHPQLISFNEDKQCVRVPANNDWCHASTSSYGKYGLENFRSKEFRAEAPRCWHPTHILLDPGSAGRGPQRTTAINNRLTRYSTQ